MFTTVILGDVTRLRWWQISNYKFRHGDVITRSLDMFPMIWSPIWSFELGLITSVIASQ